MEKGKLEPPLSAWERGGGEDGRQGNEKPYRQERKGREVPIYRSQGRKEYAKGGIQVTLLDALASANVWCADLVSSHTAGVPYTLLGVVFASFDWFLKVDRFASLASFAVKLFPSFVSLAALAVKL